jgi:SWI/SNF-related matrix-associated actin-dependent regulator of chromatin subfamily A-like protein 1
VKVAPYQEVAIQRLLEHETYGCFDPAGTGKTAVAINAFERLDRYPVIVTAPAHLITQWEEELIAWGCPPEEIAATPRGTKARDRKAALESNAAIKIVSYNAWHSDTYSPYLLDRNNAAFVFDESHRLRKGRRGKGAAWQNVKRLRTKTRSKHLHTPVWWLSGTPLVKDATDLWPFLAMCEPFRFTSREDFAHQYCRTWYSDYGLQVGKLRDRAGFQRLMGKHSIKRSWTDIPELASLSSIVPDVPLLLTREELSRQRHIKQHRRDPITGEALWSNASAIRALRRITMPAKLDAASELFEDRPGRWLCVAWYRSSASDLFDRANRIRRGSVSYIDGSTLERDRQMAYRRYKRDPEHVIVGTIGALKEGLNLQAGHKVMFAEEHYLSADNDQAVNRVLRRGQTQPVLVYKLYCRNSFDVRVRATARRRHRNIEEAFAEFLEE